jgi:predicted MFS family arabinose efflux permease
MGEQLAEREFLTNRWLVLAILLSVYGVAGADRTIISVLAEPIRRELNLSDSQLGALSGLIFALFHTSVGLPIAWPADRFNRVRIIAAAAIFWSGFTYLAGFSTNFVQLALTRVGVAVGEAGCAPPSHSLISDYYPREQRATALGIFVLGFPLGIGLGTAASASITALHGWRVAFEVLSMFGTVLSLVLVVVVRHSNRGRLDRHRSVPAQAQPFWEVFKGFCRNPVFRATTLAGTFATFTSYGVTLWIPAFLMREKGMTMLDIAHVYGVVSGGALMAGSVLSGLLVDRISPRNKSAPALIPGLAFLLCIPFLLAAFWVSSWQAALAFLVVPFVLLAIWPPPTLALLQNLSEPEARASTSAIFIAISSIIGNGAGPLYVGFISDIFRQSATNHALASALTTLIPLFVLTGFIYFRIIRAANAPESRREPPVSRAAIT